jgi:hypothetical protein
MPTFSTSLRSLLNSGRVVLNRRPEVSHEDRGEIKTVLEESFEQFSLQLAGPQLALHFDTAMAAGNVVLQACWFLVSDAEPELELERCLVMPWHPQTPEQHLSADLLFRFLPQVHQRALALDRGDKLPILLAELVRRWPLSGVLSSVAEPALTSLDFGHPGLQMLYAERLAGNTKPGWLPDGRGLEYVELVWKELGKDAAALIRARQHGTVAGSLVDEGHGSE